MASKEYHSGHDIKSLALNLATILLIFLPFAVYSYQEHIQLSVSIVVGFMLFTLILPPMGWRRPHPYSDDPNNRPYTRKAD